MSLVLTPADTCWPHQVILQDGFLTAQNGANLRWIIMKYPKDPPTYSSILTLGHEQIGQNEPIGYRSLSLLLLLLLLLLETKTAAQHSCHMLQVRDFKGTLFGIGSKVWRDVSSWTSCRCGTQVLVALFLVF